MEKIPNRKKKEKTEKFAKERKISDKKIIFFNLSVWIKFFFFAFL